MYLAQRKSDGETVVLKEGRPHAGWTGHNVLTRLADVPGVPDAYERFTVWEHHYLAMQRMPGTSLGNWLALHYPLTRRDGTEADLLAYRDRALGVLAQVERIVGDLHERGIVFGDLHADLPALNVLVADDGTVSLIDFELAFDVASGARPGSARRTRGGWSP